ncbi:helix-turn-helix domain-containing protein [Campylobacter pinnipediorum]|uniref:helix-turn-helix domain-containing protein n=1 Tax=Campylobacter pinnipediorum TaxID=1965231 RepID=UPI0009953A7A|nr:helix-turn-helix transcriptional regulator [Campylobacter pinnipediorum]AQW83014.1 putative transcriptional regulator, XRE family [Campylobacter pinnipediorum subsp. pinnipediorum]
MGTNKISQIIVSLKVGVTQSAVSHWFRGESKPTIEHALIMEEHFNIPISAWCDIRSYILNNSERFGAIKTLRKQHNDNTKV